MSIYPKLVVAKLTMRHSWIYLDVMLHGMRLHILSSLFENLRWKQLIVLNANHQEGRFHSANIVSRHLSAVCDHTSLDQGPLFHHTFLFVFAISLAVHDAVWVLSCKHYHVLGAEAIACTVDPTSICDCVGVFILCSVKHLVDDGQDFLRCMACKLCRRRQLVMA